MGGRENLPTADNGQPFIAYHGTSRQNANSIQWEGFRPSTGGCGGQGVYVAASRKASRFAHDFHRADPVLLKCQVTVKKPKYTSSDCATWQGEGFDGCRLERTSRSTNPEWCILRPDQIQVLEVQSLAGQPRPAT
uniref:PARP catalytic domain-containing protein n=1 Tax=Alexandrium monilatum TaxID=311494 RepID=A0A7S4WJV7_9DINO|mmetsp:Transcript_10254/g.30861  ORF Transcript_10254/g.30861 Transcript_10254/m.30861 type:complete len:135 (-) Transcript_10254:82-486(-)